MGVAASSSDCCCSKEPPTLGDGFLIPQEHVTGRERSSQTRSSSKEPTVAFDANSERCQLVYIERWGNHLDQQSSTDVGSKRSFTSVTSAVAKTLSVLRTSGLGVVSVSPAELDKAKLAIFSEMLQRHCIETAAWGASGAKSVEHLFWEAYEQRGCLITGMQEVGRLKRVTRLVKLRLVSDIFGVEHVLLSRMQFMHDGQFIERKQVPLRRLLWSKSAEENCSNLTEDVLSAERCPLCEDWRDGYRKALQERLGLSERFQEQHLREEPGSYRYYTEDNIRSAGFPGLNTLYCIHEITLRVTDPENAQVLGLPQGQEFATTEGDFNFNGQAEDCVPIGSQLNIWMWARNLPSPSLKAEAARAGGAAPVRAPIEQPTNLIKRVPLPPGSAQALHSLQERVTASKVKSSRSNSCSVLQTALKDRKTIWAKVNKMAQSIMDPKYTLQQYHADLAAFPELDLYLMENTRVTEVPGNLNKCVSSGRTIGDEYQRTVGAFFAIYWLMRLHTDGKDGFSFGVDDAWMPMTPKSNNLQDEQKRINFRENSRWDDFTRLLLDAGLLTEQKRGAPKVNVSRLVALLALTAVHDIMKLDPFLPEVQEEHAPWHGYKSGDVITDHDQALAYVMDFFPELLPSFQGLDPADKNSVQFSQSKLSFNHGWFVQAEAPPGPIFTSFRQVLIRDHKSRIGSRDIALYFVHWLTDLAGAEPSPLGGCEKFVVKFPLAVLNSFLRSFEFVQKISDHTETEVMEEYLKLRWSEHTPCPGPLPTGSTALAKMRLLCMAQMNAEAILKGFEDLTSEDKETLSVEMARSGCVAQSFSMDIIPEEVYAQAEGPAFLIYYGPAFLQSLGNDRAVDRLIILAEVYRCARALWPTSIAKGGSTVIVRIDTIKSIGVGAIVGIAAKDTWVLLKHNDNEAFIERASKRKLNKLIASGQSIQVLDLTSIHTYCL